MTLTGGRGESVCLLGCEGGRREKGREGGEGERIREKRGGGEGMKEGGR